VAQHVGQGRVSMIHFDAHADTGDIEFGSLIGHGQPMRRLIESGALRGDRFLQMGLRGYWPEPETLAWMARQGMRSFGHSLRQRRYPPKPSNSPFRTPPRKARHSSDVNLRTGPDEYLLLRTPISPPGRLATSTQLPLA
jgi:Arginase family